MSFIDLEHFLWFEQKCGFGLEYGHQFLERIFRTARDDGFENAGGLVLIVPECVECVARYADERSFFGGEHPGADLKCDPALQYIKTLMRYSVPVQGHGVEAGRQGVFQLCPGTFGFGAADFVGKVHAHVRKGWAAIGGKYDRVVCRYIFHGHLRVCDVRIMQFGGGEWVSQSATEMTQPKNANKKAPMISALGGLFFVQVVVSFVLFYPCA